MLKFKEFEYTTFHDNGLENETFLLGRDVWIEYGDNTPDHIPQIVFGMLVEAFQGSVLEVLRSRNLLFHANYYYNDGNGEIEDCATFLSTPTTYSEVFGVAA